MVTNVTDYTNNRITNDGFGQKSIQHFSMLSCDYYIEFVMRTTVGGGIGFLRHSMRFIEIYVAGRREIAFISRNLYIQPHTLNARHKVDFITIIAVVYYTVLTSYRGITNYFTLFGDRKSRRYYLTTCIVTAVSCKFYYNHFRAQPIYHNATTAVLCMVQLLQQHTLATRSYESRQESLSLLFNRRWRRKGEGEREGREEGRQWLLEFDRCPYL